jgi:serine/threonine protein kinase
MAPEVLAGKAYGFKADIYSLGAIYYELLVGDYVFGSKILDEFKR